MAEQALALEHADGAAGAEQIERIIDMLLEGHYRSVPTGSDALTTKLRTLADMLHDRAKGDLERVVQMSMNTSEAVTNTAEMMRSVHEVDRRTQSIASAAEEMVASVQEISHNAEAASGEAQTARESAHAGTRDADEAVRTMEHIARTVEEAAAKVDGLAEASEKIGDIVLQIEAIAKQTNLLALNATIEAARAGDAGKGFAVVAGEVKNLATQTGKATEDISQRIDQLRAEMQGIVSSMQEGAEAVHKGQEVINHTGEGMRAVADGIENVTAKMGEISEILAQQTEASSEISEGIHGIKEMSGQNVERIGAIIDVMDRSDDDIMDAVNALGQLEIQDFTVLVAKSDHMLWRKKLSEMVVGRMQLKSGELADHHTCRLGKWYDNVEDREIREHPAFRELEAPHRKVHAAGIEAARRFEQGDLDGALENIRDVASSSMDVLHFLDELAKRHDAA